MRQLILAIYLLHVGCNPQAIDSRLSSGESEKTADETEEEKEQDPTSIAGTNLIDFDNGRVRCRYRGLGNDKYEIACDATVVDKRGNETLATGFEPGVSFTWQDMRKVTGSDFDILECSNPKNTLNYSCKIKLQKKIVTNVEAAAKIEVGRRARFDSDNVILPYAFSSYGLVKQVPRLFLHGDTQAPEFGFQTFNISPEENLYSHIYSMCEQGERLFFSSGQYVYVYENNKIEIYAGNPNLKNRDELSHRLRTHLGRNIDLVCGKQSLFVRDGFYFARILEISDAGPVKIVAGDVDSIVQPQAGMELKQVNISNASSFNFDKNGRMYFSHWPSETIWRVDEQGKIHAIGGGGTSGLKNIRSLTITGDDDVLFFSEQKRLQKIDKLGVLSTLVGGSAATSSAILSANQKAVDTLLSMPWDLEIDAQGDLYIAEYSGSRALVVKKSTGNIHVFAGTGEATWTGMLEGKLATEQHTSFLYSILKRKNGDVLLGAGTLGVIFRVDAQNKIYRYLGNFANVGSNQGAQAEILLGNVMDIDLDKDGNIYLTHHNQDVLQKIDNHGKITTVLPANDVSSVSFSASSQDVYFTQFVTSIADPSGSAFLNRLNANGQVEGIAGLRALPNFIGENGSPALDATFSQTLPLASKILKGSGDNIFIADRGNNRIRRLYRNGNENFYRVETIAGTGEGGFSGDGDLATLAKLNSPDSVTELADGSLVFTDFGNSTIRKIDAATKKISTIAGVWPKPSILTQPERFEDNALAKNAGLAYPTDLVATSDGRIYFIDAEFSAVKVLEPIANTSDYSLRTVIGNVSKDCGLGIQGYKATSLADEFKDKFAASMSVLCLGTPKALAIRENCSEPNGKFFMALLQNFNDVGAASNILKLELPCDVKF